MDSRRPREKSSRLSVEELNFLILRYLSTTEYKRTSEMMLEEVREHRGLPMRYDWEGNKHYRSYEDLVKMYREVPSSRLLDILEEAEAYLYKEIPPNVRGVHTFLGVGSLSLLRTKESMRYTRWPSSMHAVVQHRAPPLPPANLATQNLAKLLRGREMTGVSRRSLVLSKDIYSQIGMLDRKLGHLSAVYCVTFDRSGRFIITGADDALLKIWSACDGRLLATLRGHHSEIADIAVSYENHLLASGSTDKLIRVWSLRTKAPICVLQGHTGTITSVQFCPQTKGSSRFLLSTGCDGNVCFWKWNINTNAFDPKPNKFVERSRAGAQMLCSSFSRGGVFLATGNADHTIRVYFLHPAGPAKICELEAHTERVDSIAYSNSSDRFLSGSKDGTARIWRSEHHTWKAIVLNMAAKPSGPDGTSTSEVEDSKKKLMVTMVSWNLDDTRVVTAVSDFSLKVWDTQTGRLLHILKGHEDEMFVLEASPVDPRILVSAGHDGMIFIWDILAGVKIKHFTNAIEGQGHGAVFDLKFAPDGQSFAATDSHGHLLLFAFGTNERSSKIPKELFFHTDYRPLIWDPTNIPLDEQTQQPPHLMPPPFLVDIDGNPYPPQVQRLVPGRENCKDDQLIPHVAVNEEGESEVLGDNDHDDVRIEAIRNDRRSIDDMIEQLLREHDYQQPNDIIANNDGLILGSPRGQRHIQGLIAMRRSGEMEGVRQSLGNMAQRITAKDLALQGKKVVVKPLDPYVLKRSEEVRLAYAEEEYTKKRKDVSVELAPSSGRKLAKAAKPSASAPPPPAALNEETGVNRLLTRALYDTEEEEGESSATELWNESNADDSSDYSDWMADQGSNLQPPKRRSTRQPKRRRISLSSSPADDDEEEDTNNDDDDDDDDEDVEFKETKPRKRPPAKKKKKQPKAQTERVRKRGSGIREVPEEFRPPEWLTDVIPRKAPYVPQMGDEVMYFRQGHELYVNAVHKKKVYEINPRKNQPWHKIPNLREQELVKIVGIRYEVKPPRLCCLKLAFIDHENGRLTGGSFSIKYHDMPDVIDFLVLRQNYDTAMQRRWTPDDRFRSMIDDQWWMGTIVSQESFQAEYPDSMFQCFNVHWDNNEYEKMSPWDMEPIDELRLPSEVGGGVEVTGEELKVLMYTPKSSEWPSCGRDAECDRLVRGIEAIMEHSAAEPFSAPVDLNAFPEYAIIIEYPIDLSTIKGRLENRFYRRVNAVQYDARYVESNAGRFNEPGSKIVQSAKAVSETLLKLISDSSMTDPLPLLNSLTRGLSRSANGAPHSPSPPSTSRKRRREGGGSLPASKRRREELPDPAAWHQECSHLLSTLLQCRDSEPFRRPVNPEDYPDYYNIVTSPMDLATVREQFDEDVYHNPNEFAKDIRLIFSNSRAYNTNKRSRIYTMTLRLSAMFEEKMREVVVNWKSACKGQGRGRSLQSTRDRSSGAGSSRQRGAGNSRLSFPSASQASQSSSSSSSTSHRKLPRLPNGQFAPRNRSPQPSTSRSSAATNSRRRVIASESSSESSSEQEEEREEEQEEDDEATEIEEQEDEENERRAPRQPAKSSRDSGKTSLTNGQNSYRTRAATGSLKPKHYGSSDENEVESAQKATPRSRRPVVCTESSDKSDSSSNETATDSEDTVVQEKSSGEENEENDEDADSDYRLSARPRPCRSATLPPVGNSSRQPTKAKKSSRKAGTSDQRKMNLRDSSSRGGKLRIQTRNQGRRTVHYHEDSDNDARHGVGDDDNVDEDGSDDDSENSSSDEETPGSGRGSMPMTMSSRGRIRRLTARARANLMGAS